METNRMKLWQEFEARKLTSWLEFISGESKVIICLIYACKGPVPEEVLGLLYAAANLSKDFLLSMHDLSPLYGNYLTQTISTVAPWTDDARGRFNPGDFRAWSLSSPLRDYMDMNMAGHGTIRSLLNTLLRVHERSDQYNRDSQTEAFDCERTKVVTALRALYFDQTHRDEAVRDAGTRAATACSRIESNDSRYECRRAIEPIIWLLHQSLKDDGEMTVLQLRSVRRIFLKYVYERQLDDSNISVLLRFDSYALAPIAALTAIHRIYSVLETPLLNEHHLGFLEVLGDHLKSDENVHIRIQKAACDALLSISSFFRKVDAQESMAVVVNTPGILAALESLMKDSAACITSRSANILARSAIGALDDLSCASEESAKLRILKEDRIITLLAIALCKDDNPPLQDMAASIFGNLTYGMGYKALQILNEHEERPASPSENLRYQVWSKREEGALSGLVRLLSNNNNPQLQKRAARALMNLTAGHGNGRERLNIQILNQPTALAELVKLISKDDYPSLQEAAAGSLMNLAFGPESLRLEILQEDGAIAALVKSLSKDSNPGLQEYAAATLNYLTHGRESRNIEILKEPMALVNLVRSLSKDDQPNLQIHTAAAMWALSSAEESTKLRIVQEDGALANLVRSLSKDDCPSLQEAAAGALMELTKGKESLQLDILTEDGALAALVKSLMKVDNPRLQENAAQALNNLADGSETIRIEIMKEPMAIPNLVMSLSKHDNPKLQEYARGALTHLVCGQKSLQMAISEEYGDIAALFKN